MKILVVEDNALIAMEHEMLIEDLGHDCVAIASNSVRALEAARTEAPDLALVDLGLADGWTGPAYASGLTGVDLLGRPVPGHEIVEAVHLVVCDAGEDPAKPGLWIDVVHPGGFDERVGDGGSFTAAL